jgi:lipoyl(octanoyl) transferase
LSYNVEYKDIGLKPYKEAWDYQEAIFNKLLIKKISGYPGRLNPDVYDSGVLIITEHPHVYTLGKSGSGANLLIDNDQLRAKGAEFYRTDRGGDITYHGPGQIVGYPVFDLELIQIGLKEYVSRLEEAIILTLSGLGLSGSRLNGATGVWLDPDQPGKARKICAIGVKASRHITMHGFAFNVNTDLSFFSYINPCGFTDRGVTSLQKEFGTSQDFEDIKERLRKNLKEVFDLNWVY